MRIHTFCKRVEQKQIVTVGMFNAQEIRELERLGYRRTHIEEITLDKKPGAENKNGIPVHGKRRKPDANTRKRTDIRGGRRASSTR